MLTSRLEPVKPPHFAVAWQAGRAYRHSMILDGAPLRVWNLSQCQDKLGITAGGVPVTRLINTTAPLAGGGDLSADRTLSIPKATAAVDGYLASADFITFSGKESTLTFTAPLVRVANAISIPAATNAVDGYLTAVDHTTFAAKESVLTFNVPLSRAVNAVSIADAVADGATKGAAAFTAADFNSAAGIISIDYTNGQAASAVNKGFLTSADWSTFNAKVSATRAVNTTAPLTGGGTLAADLTLAISAATTSTAGSQSALDFTQERNAIAMHRGGMYMS